MLTQQVLGTSAAQQSLLYKTGANSTVQALTTGLLGRSRSSDASQMNSFTGVYSTELTGGVAGYLGRVGSYRQIGTEAINKDSSYIQVVEGNQSQYTSNWAAVVTSDQSSFAASFFENYGSTLGVSDNLETLYANGGRPSANGYGETGLHTPLTSEGSMGNGIPDFYSNNADFSMARIPESYTSGNNGVNGIPTSYTSGVLGADMPTGDNSASIPESYINGNLGASMPNAGNPISIPNSYTSGNLGASMPNAGNPVSIPDSYTSGNLGASMPTLDNSASIPSTYINGDNGAVLPEMFLNGDISADIDAIFNSVMSSQQVTSQEMSTDFNYSMLGSLMESDAQGRGIMGSVSDLRAHLV